MKKTLATSLILSFALIGAAQATPRGDSDNEPFQGSYGQSDARPEGSVPQARNDVQPLPPDQQSQMVMGEPDDQPFQGS